MFHTFFYQPILNALVGIYTLLPGGDLGVAIVVLTIVLRLLLYPLSRKALRSQQALQEIQPEIEKIRKKNKDQQAAARAIMALYRERGIHPMSSFLPILFQLPVLFALYRVLFSGLTEPIEVFAADLYGFITVPEVLPTLAFGGLLDLTARSPFLAAIAGGAQFFQSKLALKRAPKKDKKKKGDFASTLSFQMRYFFPVLTVFIAGSLPAGIALYWVVTTLFAIGQHLIFLRPKTE